MSVFRTMVFFSMVLLSNLSTFRTTMMVMKSFHEICGGPFCGGVGSCPCPDAALIIRTKNYYNLMIFLHVTINNVRDLLGTQCIILQHRPTSTTFIFRSTEVGTYHHEPIEEA